KKPRLAAKSVGVDEDNFLSIQLFENFKKFRDSCEKSLQKVEQARVDSALTAPFAQVIVDLVQEATKRYQYKKQRYAKLDFADIEHTMLKVLDDPVAVSLLREQITHIFVDEYQDINPLQDTIISKLAQNAQSFFVGDVKQSIYGFRMCDPKYFVQKQQDDRLCKINLNGNFRSSAPILQFVNRIFEGSMTAQYGGVDYLETSMLQGDRPSDIEVPIYLARIEPTPKGKEKTTYALYDPLNHPLSLQSDQSNVSAEIAAVTKHIANLHNQQGVAKKDIAVLVRSRGAFAYGLQKALLESGISAFVGKERGVMESEECAALFAYLSLVDYPYDDIALASVLMSGFYGLQSSDLEQVKAFSILQSVPKTSSKSQMDKGSNRTKPFYDLCKEFLEAYKAVETDQEKQVLVQKLSEFFACMEIFVKYQYTHTVQELAGKIVSQHDYFSYLLSTPGGESKADGLYDFLCALGSDPHNLCLSKYLFFTKRNPKSIKESGTDDTVQIITVHASKGLEYDYLMVADLAKKFNVQDQKQSVLLHGGNLALQYFDLDKGAKSTNAVYEYTKQKMQESLLSEEMRLLYVALTRAKKQLALFCRIPKEDYQPPEDFSQCKSWLDIVYPICESIRESGKDKQGVVFESFAYDDCLPMVQKLDIKKVYSQKDKALIAKYQKSMTPIYQGVSKGAGKKTTVSRVLLDDKVASNMQSDDAISSEVTPQDFKKAQKEQQAKQVGTSYHQVLEWMDFSKPFEECLLAVQNSFSIDFDTLKKPKIKQAHALLAQLTQGKKIYKEIPFVQNNASGQDQDSLMQGKIDLVILDTQDTTTTATIVEYKSTVSKSTLPQYKKQLQLYADALTSILQIPVTNQLILDISKGVFVQV
ncbi:MAG: UvrD-helicase domain-containing protein, partial [Firmicutes bacterium]|nr:UvrD-helicase domain-containing protein [Bacillota bacterium]